MGEFLTHPIVAPVLAGLTLAVVLGVAKAVRKLVSEVRDLRVDLVEHMRSEEDLREKEEQRVVSIEQRQERMEGLLDQLVAWLIRGNPEVRK